MRTLENFSYCMISSHRYHKLLVSALDNFFFASSHDYAFEYQAAKSYKQHSTSSLFQHFLSFFFTSSIVITCVYAREWASASEKMERESFCWRHQQPGAVTNRRLLFFHVTYLLMMMMIVRRKRRKIAQLPVLPSCLIYWCILI